MGDSGGSFYNLHVMVEQTSGLNYADGETLDPKIKLVGFDQTKYSTVKSGVAAATSVVWNEHFFFSKTLESSTQLDDEFLEISVLDTSKTLRSAVVGSITMNLAAVYLSEQRKIVHSWSVLQNRDSKSALSKAQGYIKFSVAMAKDSENRPSLEPESVQDIMKRVENLSSLEIPPTIKLNMKQLQINVYKGKDIVALDENYFSTTNLSEYMN